MSYSSSLKQQAIDLRKQGSSMAEIARRFKISKSTASVWLSNIKLSDHAKQKIQNRSDKARARGVRTMTIRREKQETLNIKEAKTILKSFNGDNPDLCKIITSLLFWCEGSKHMSGGVQFANSDPILIKMFITTLRKSYRIDEHKFHITVHLHEYHDPDTQIAFWSKVTGIPKTQFFKPYIKPHTGKRKKDAYPGCISLRYADASLARRLTAVYHTFAKDLGGLV